MYFLQVFYINQDRVYDEKVMQGFVDVKDTEVEIPNLKNGEKYNIKVAAFEGDVSNQGHKNH